MRCKFLIYFICIIFSISAKPDPKPLLKKKLPVFFQPISGGDTLQAIVKKLEAIVMNGGFSKLENESYERIMEEGKQQVLDFIRDPANLQLKPGESIEKKTSQAFGSVSAKAQSVEVIFHETSYKTIDSIGILFKLIPPYSNYSKPSRLMFPIGQTLWNGNPDSLSYWLSKKLI